MAARLTLGSPLERDVPLVGTSRDPDEVKYWVRDCAKRAISRSLCSRL